MSCVAVASIGATVVVLVAILFELAAIVKATVEAGVVVLSTVQPPLHDVMVEVVS